MCNENLTPDSNDLTLDIHLFHNPAIIPMELFGNLPFPDFIGGLVYKFFTDFGRRPIESINLFVAKSTNRTEPISEEELSNIIPLTIPLYGISAVVATRDENGEEIFPLFYFASSSQGTVEKSEKEI